MVLDTPELPKGFNNYCDVLTFKFILLFDPHHCDIPFEYVKGQQKEFMDLINRLAVKYPQLILVDPKKVLCDCDCCKTSLNGIPIYADSHHLNYLGSQEID